MEEFAKSQNVRLFDVVALGPFMIWFADQADDSPEWARWALALTGVATIAYNGLNYVRNVERPSYGPRTEGYESPLEWEGPWLKTGS